MLFDALALISLLIVIAQLRKLANIFPSLLACLIRFKENINLETSAKLRRSRDTLFLTMFVPFCLVIQHFGLYRPDFLRGMQEGTASVVTIGVFVGYVLLRLMMFLIPRPRKMDANICRYGQNAGQTYFLIITLLLLATGGVLSFCGVGMEDIRIAMIWISGAIYLIFLIRKTQIFATSCNFFVAFLYLCALEIVPTGVLIASAMIF